MAPHITASHSYPLVKLPHPYLATYEVHTVAEGKPKRLKLEFMSQTRDAKPLPQSLHHESLSWTHPALPPKDQCPPESNNSAWARACRSPQTVFEWAGTNAPSLGQIWNVIHAIYLAHPTIEQLRLALLGAENSIVRNELLVTGLAIEHPKPWQLTGEESTWSTDEVLILRSSFWQGAASPMGPRPIWIVGEGSDGPLRQSLAQYPLMPENYQLTMKFPHEAVYAHHPVRRPKPHPGSLVYSRYIPELNEYFSLEVVDWQNDEHLKLFNVWQNDPRVAKGWNETGTLNQHREYLKRLHLDPHVLCLYGRFDDKRFAYFELYWGKVSAAKTHSCFSQRMIFTVVFAGRSLWGTLGRGRL
jgi:hypothetical protein